MEHKYVDVVKRKKHIRLHDDIYENMWSKLYLNNYTTMITERVSSLENFYNCPHKYDNVPFDGSSIKTFIAVSTWDILHVSHQYPDKALLLANEFCDVTIPTLTGNRDNILKEQILMLIEKSRSRIEEFKDKKKWFEVKNVMIIEWVIVTWSYDALIQEDDGTYHMFDFKTASNINYYANRLEKLQPLVYTYFVMVQHKIESMLFSYEIYVKSKSTSKITVYRKTKMMYMKKHNQVNQVEYIDDIENKVKKVLENYRMAKETEFFQPQRCSSCFYCPLRNAWENQCQLWKDQSVIIDESQEISFSF